jgi:hypothetical protein
MVLLLDNFLAETRISGVDEAELAGLDPVELGPWVEMTVRAIHGRLGAPEGAAYAEAFRYESLEGQDLLQPL